MHRVRGVRKNIRFFPLLRSVLKTKKAGDISSPAVSPTNQNKTIETLI